MKPHKHAELIKAWADGAEIEVKDFYGDWVADKTPNWTWNEYRIKPESKQYVVIFERLSCVEDYTSLCGYSIMVDCDTHNNNIKYTFDGETGELKSAEVLK